MCLTLCARNSLSGIISPKLVKGGGEEDLYLETKAAFVYSFKQGQVTSASALRTSRLSFNWLNSKSTKTPNKTPLQNIAPQSPFLTCNLYRSTVIKTRE